MPDCLNTSLKTTKLTLLLLFSPLFLFAQHLTGLWTGILSNDSSTVRKDQSFEIALTEYRGKVYGYSRSEFIVNDTLYYIVKRVKGVIEGDVCEVKDDEIVSYNFRGKLDKGVKLINTFRLNKEDSSWQLDGKWKTNATKKYYPISGKTELKVENDLSKSKLFPHLEELKLADNVVFYKEQKKKEEQQNHVVNLKKDLPPAKEVIVSPFSEKNNAEAADLTSISVTEPKKPVIKKEEISGAVNKKTNSTSGSAIQNIKSKTTIPFSEIKKPVLNSNEAATLVHDRESIFAQTVFFKSDSLQLALYDNGEIDGDTVSLLLNGEIILAKQGLKATAIRKTIYTSAGNNDSLVLVLYAENLGKYPPNTGLLVVRDGEDVYNVRFSADFQKNAAIVLRRKK